MKILIAGAGIGGLTTALMLHRRGIAAELYEQSPSVREVGGTTRPLNYFNRQVQEVWREPRGVEAGHKVPQFSIHRGRLQKLLHDAVLERLGPDAVRTGLGLAGFMRAEAGDPALL